MIDNKALSPEAWFHTKRALACVEALNKVGFAAVYAATREEAAKTVLEAIPKGATVGIGGSVTVRELGLPEALKRKGCKVFDHWDQSLSPEERGRTRYSQIVADVFLSSTNAVTMKGTLINIDGFGNRVASMMFGPQTTIIVCGYNKIVDDVDQGLARIWNYAGPINYKRLGREIHDTISEVEKAKLFACTTILSAKPGGKEKFLVVIVGEKLGY